MKSTAPSLADPTPEDMRLLVSELDKNFIASRTSRISHVGKWDADYRISQLKALRQLLIENEPAFAEAGRQDLGKTHSEWFNEYHPLLAEIKFYVKNLKKWMKKNTKPTPIWLLGTSSYTVHEPYGVCLVLGAWNFNCILSLNPLAAAIAAGNACVVKPSELAPNSARLMAELLPKYLDSKCCRCVTGDATTASALLEQNWGFVFFTGSTRTGALVGASCAKRLIPYGLELGGKSPTIIDKQCDLKVMARRVVQGKYSNCGQTCIAPDYVIVIGSDARKKEVFQALDKEISNQFGTDVSKSADFARIVNEPHFKRITAYLNQGTILRGGKTDASKLFIEPTIMEPSSQEKVPIMEEEIFGPVLPRICMETKEEACQYINARAKPLALYIFSSNTTTIDHIISQTTSGATCVNDATLHFASPYLPFGGVGASGTGSYHGYSSFTEFSHEKAVLHAGTRFDIRAR